MEITISKQYESLIPKLSKQDMEELKDSIDKVGIYEPITLNSAGLLLDGHHRFNAWKALGKNPQNIPYKIKDFDKLTERRFVIEVNLRRRHLLLYQRAALALELKKIEDEEAKLRSIQSGESYGRGKKNRIDKNLSILCEEEKAAKLEKARINREKRAKRPPKERKEIPKKKTTAENKGIKDRKARERAAKKANLSDESLRQYQYVLEHSKDPQLVENMK